jgi:hypothetical protein
MLLCLALTTLAENCNPTEVRGNQIGSFHFIICGLTFFAFELVVRLTTFIVLESNSLSSRTGLRLLTQRNV